jgi:hypothetical protein
MTLSIRGSETLYMLCMTPEKYRAVTPYSTKDTDASDPHSP